MDTVQLTLLDWVTSKRLEAMASLIIFNSASVTRPVSPARPFFKPWNVSNPAAIRFPVDPFRRRTRGLTAVTRAGPPSTNSYIFAFALPFSLLAITIFASIRVADKLDRDYLQELAMIQAIKDADEDEEEEEEGEEEDEEDIDVPFKKEPAIQRSRNRPKRTV